MRFLAPISSILFVLCVWVVIGGGARVLFTTGVGPAELFGLLVWAAIGFGFFRLAEWLRARGARGAS